MAVPMDASLRAPTLTQMGKKWIGGVQDEWRMYSDDRSDYELGPAIGFGASSIVYYATYRPPEPDPPIPCALKVLDLDKLPQSSLHLLTRETRLMSLSKHPNVLRVRGSWMYEHKLYIALRLMKSGSVSDIMRYKWAGGVEEEVARCVLKQALEGLNYLHVNGFIHRDVKAANLLVDDDGTVLLGDLGVAASLTDDDHPTHSHKRTALSFDSSAGAIPRHPPGHSATAATGLNRGKRKSFVGTPCWMAPEVIAQKHYDSSADIWSLGITALELCHGRAPNSRDPINKVLMKTLQNAPPTLDRTNGQFKYSKAFKEIIESCLVKDPTQRPTAAQLLQTPFFKGAKKKSYLVDALLAELPPLAERQERRVQPSLLSRASMDSWDFSLMPASPTSTSRRSASDQEPSIAEDGGSSHHTHLHHRPALTTRTSYSTTPVFPIEMEEEPDAPADTDGGESGTDAEPAEDLPAGAAIDDSEAAEAASDAGRAAAVVVVGPASAPVPTSAVSESHALPALTSSSSATPSASSHLAPSPHLSSANSSPPGPATPPPGLDAYPSAPEKGKTGLWRKITGKKSSEKEKDKEREKERSASGSGSFLGALLERTTSRSGDNSKTLLGNITTKSSSNMRAGKLVS